MEIARSACPNELLWQELSFLEVAFRIKLKSRRRLDNATMSRSHGHLHAMELSLQISAVPAALILCVVWGGA